jgi:flagellar protein FliS
LTQLKRELNRLKGCIDEKDLVARSDASTRALMTVHLLGTSLDFEKGGAIATNLFQLYEHIRLTVIKAGNENDSNVLRSAIIVAGDIEDAWKSLIELSAK